MGSRTVGFALAIIFLGYLGLIFVVPPVEDELYYWCWAKNLQWSYYDHPLMTALMIRGSTEVFGDNMFGIRFPSVVATTVILGVLAWLTRPRTILIGALLTPIYTFGAVIITPDTPLLLFWSLYLAWLVVVHRRLDAFEPLPLWLWGIGGILLGCGILGKYTTGLAIPAGLTSFLLLGRMHFKRWMTGYALHILVAFVVTTPILIHNFRHDFAPLLFQWRHSMAVDDTPGIQSCGEFIGVQVLLFGTMPLLILPWVWKRRRELLAQPLTRVCVCMYALPLVFFIWKSTRGPIEGNWALASYLGFWPIAAAWWERVAKKSLFWKWHGRLMFGIPTGCVVLLTIHLIHPLPFIPVRADRIGLMQERIKFAEKVAVELRAASDLGPVFVPDYQWVAYLRYCGVDAHQLVGVWRPSHFTQRPEKLTDYPQTLFFCDYELPPQFREGVTEKNRFGRYEFRLRGEEIGVYQVRVYQRTEPTPPSP